LERSNDQQFLMDGYRRYARSGLAAGRRRVPLKAAKKFLMENTTALKSFAEYVAPGELSSLDELEHGQGAIVRQGLMKVAAGDCPCHGSMSDIDGAPINAPAVGPLGKIQH
jgi:hypothetical protein